MIDVKVSHEGVEDDEPPSSGWLQTCVEQTLKEADFQGGCEVSILLVDDQRMQELNKQYRDKDSSTDVLSFALEDEETMPLPEGAPRMLGDVVLSLETLERQAADNRGTHPKETAWALAHGVLHLLGYDHDTDEEEAEMRALEQKVLAALGEDFFQW